MKLPRFSAPWLFLISLVVPLLSSAQDSTPRNTHGERDVDLGWTASVEFSYVASYGNAETETMGLRSTFRYRWLDARYTLRADGLRSNNADEKFVQVLAIPDENTVIDAEDLFVLVRPQKKLDAEKYLIETVYDRVVSNRLFWNVGFTWDSNKDANILNRYLLFGGFGHIWWNRDELHFETSYGLSYTRRKEERPDPDKDLEFPGLRLSSSYWNKWGATTLGNDWVSNFNLRDASDWNFDTTTFVTVSMNRFMGIKASLQWLYNGRPALQTIDVRALLPEGVEVDFGDVRIPKETLDTIFKTSIVFDF